MPSFLRFLILVAAIALPRLAFAQDITWGGDPPCVDGDTRCTLVIFGGSTRPSHRSTGDADLDRAIALCDANDAAQYYNGSMGGSPLWGYSERCQWVLKAWENSSSEKARREAEEAAKKAADEAWLDSYVKGLPK